VFPQTDWQRCVVHWYRNVFSHTPNGKVAEVARMLKAIHAQEDRKAAQTKAAEIVTRLKEMKLRTAAELVEQKVGETLTYYKYPSTHWRSCVQTTLSRADHSRNATPDSRGRSVPRRRVCFDVGRGQTPTHRLDQVGQAALHGDGSAAQPGEAGGGSGVNIRNFCPAFGRSDCPTVSR
jgi:hypothetical protein